MKIKLNKKKKKKKASQKPNIEIQQNYNSPRWTGEICDCAQPMTFDQYDHCGFNCLYCFSWFQKSLKAFNPLYPTQVGNDYQTMKIRSVKHKSFDKLIKGEIKTGAMGQFHGYVKDKIVMQWGGLADPFCPYEKQYGIGLECLKSMDKVNYPCTFSTKATWWVDDPRYVKLFKSQKQWNIKMSIINLHTDRALQMEKGVPSPYKRIEAIKKICEFNRGGVTLRLRPFIIGFTDRNNEHLELIKLAHEAGATAVSTEFFCLENRAHRGTKARYEAMSEILGFDIHKFYKRNSPGATGYLRLNERIKGKYFLQMKELCDKLGMRFYVSDAHWKHLSHNGCCCGLPSEWNYSRAQYTEILCLARDRAGEDSEGLVYWNDMCNFGQMEMYKKFRYIYASGFNTVGTRHRTQHWNETMYDYLRNIWNNPNSGKSPYKYFRGLLKPVKKDNGGNVVYKYNPEIYKKR